MVAATDTGVLRGIPEFFETEINECLVARTESLATFRELGSPDLCHVVKANSKSVPKEIGSYHFVLGADTSSSATVAAYLNSLMYMLAPVQGKPNPWKIKMGTFCCFNAFSRVDVRVEVKIPGGVDSYIVDLRGDRHPITNVAIWQEAFVSAVLRAILDDNDEPDGNDGHPLLGLRKIDPLQTLGAEGRFLEAAAVEFWKGWQLGSQPEVQVATPFSNHLTNGIFSYFQNAGRLSEAAKFFADLDSRDPDVAAILAKAYLGTDEEIKAVQVLYEASKKHPVTYSLLLVQTDFLIGKKQFEKALKLAKLAVTYAPSEFLVWAKLADIYIQLSDFESALLALNSCPMFTYCERDSQRMPPPARTHLPLRADATTLRPDQNPKTIPQTNGTLFDENDPREDEVHPELQRLPSLSLRGTFLEAYRLLIRIVARVGWDDLLKFRSQVFVMEDEYLIHRSAAEESRRPGDDVDTGDDFKDEDDLEGDVSRRYLDEEQKNDIHNAANGGADKLRRSSSNTSSDVHSGDDRIMQSIDLDNGGDIASNTMSNADQAPKSASPSKGKLSIDELMKRATLEKNDSATPNVQKTRVPNPRSQLHRVSFSFKHKRLCEKWLDNLFMVLYNDLRLYTALKQEMSQFKNQTNNSNAMIYRKTGAEWEIYGDLAERLFHRDDAKEAYRLCLDQKLSTKAWLKLLQIHAEDGNIQLCLQSVVKMTTLLDRTFSEHTYPSSIGRGLFMLIRRHGFAKVQNVLISMNVPQAGYRQIIRYFEYAELFRVSGADW
ncbi:bud site selection protein [Batrachochytrium dendrobatidis]|nr:bud site selection protein [Batrachochytrium dendrobatidis]KAK5666433.1 bud site selection protein [Batrachochytrium dendrobatidis]